MKKKILLGFFTILFACSCGSPSYKFYDDENYEIFSTTEEKPYLEVSVANKINIDWIEGNVYVSSSTNVPNIQMYEEFYGSKHSKNEIARYVIEDDTLFVKYAKTKATLLENVNKDLYISIPSSFSLEEIFVNSISANVEIDGIKAINVRVETVSGNSKIYAKTDNIIVKSVSGNSEIYLNNNNCYQVVFDTVSGKFNSYFPHEINEGVYIHTSISSFCYMIYSKTVSGNLSIKLHE